MADFEKQQELALKSIAGDSLARDTLIIDLQSVAKWLADKRIGKSSAHFDDVVSTAMEGVIYAVDHFNPDRGNIVTYARHCATSKINKFLPKILAPVSIPEKRRTDGKRSYQIAKEIVSIAIDPGSSFEDEGRDLADTAPSPEEMAIAKINSEWLQAAVRQLPAREKFVICARFGEGMKHREIGAQLEGISSERVRQIEKKAIERLKKILKRDGLIFHAEEEQS
jgi:RNA polymerase sigma factor (sigma-70 family)